MTVPLRDRRRAAATREILEAARAQIAVAGPAGLSLRSVARSLGMTVQALYHYFPSRDDLITALITTAYAELVDAVANALARPCDRPRFVVAASAFRSWALAQPALFQLIYGTPLVNYAAPPEGRSTDHARRLAELFIEALFGERSPAELAGIAFPPMSPSLLARLESLPGIAIGALPPPAAALFVSIWGQVHGLVVLEAFGHTDFLGPDQAEIFESTMQVILAGIPAAMTPVTEDR